MRFTLERDHWYAMELIGSEFGEDVRACSPIRIVTIDAHGGGGRRFQMDFFHAAYPTGVQDKSYLVETVNRDENYLLGKVVNTNRMVLLFELNVEWLNMHFSAGLQDGDSLAHWCQNHSR